MFLQIETHNRKKFRFWWILLRKWRKPTKNTIGSKRWNCIHVKSCFKKAKQKKKSMKDSEIWDWRKLKKCKDFEGEKSQKVYHFIDLSISMEENTLHSYAETCVFLRQNWNLLVGGSLFIQLDFVLSLSIFSPLISWFVLTINSVSLVINDCWPII